MGSILSPNYGLEHMDPTLFTYSQAWLGHCLLRILHHHLPLSLDHFPISTPMCYNVSHLKQTLFRLCPGKLCWLFLFVPFYHKHLSKDMSTPAFSQFSQLLLDPLKWSLCFAIPLKALDEVNDLYVTKSNCEFPVFIFSDPAAAFDTVHYSSFFYKTLFSLGFLYFFGCNFLVSFANSRFLLLRSLGLVLRPLPSIPIPNLFFLSPPKVISLAHTTLWTPFSISPLGHPKWIQTQCV